MTGERRSAKYVGNINKTDVYEAEYMDTKNEKIHNVIQAGISIVVQGMRIIVHSSLYKE